MPTRIKFLGKYSKKYYSVPKMGDLISSFEGESIMLFGALDEGTKLNWNGKEFMATQFRQFFGVGKVMRVVKRENYDIVWMNFSMLQKGRTNRYVVCIDNHSRRQTLTLKRGSLASVFGICKIYYKEVIDKYNKKTTEQRLLMYAQGLQGWYVPTAVDMRKMTPNDTIEKFIRTEENKDIADFLDEIAAIEEYKENDDD